MLKLRQSESYFAPTYPQCLNHPYIVPSSLLRERVANHTQASVASGSA